MVLGAALCSLNGSGWCPALCSSSTVLHVSQALPPLSSLHFIISSQVLLQQNTALPPELLLLLLDGNGGVKGVGGGHLFIADEDLITYIIRGE